MDIAVVITTTLAETTLSRLTLRQWAQWIDEQVTQERASVGDRYLTPPPDNDEAIVETRDPAADRKQSLPGTNEPLKLRSDMALLIQKMPRSQDQWRKKRESVGLASAGNILHAIDCLTAHRFSENIHYTADHTRTANLQDTLEVLGRNASSHTGPGRFNQTISRLKSLVFIAICRVAIFVGHPKNLVDTAQREYLQLSGTKCRGADKQLQRQRVAIKWILKAMDRQFERGLEHRAFELFINEWRDIHFYTKCPKGIESNNLFAKKVPLCTIPDEVQASAPLWIPFLVKANIGDLWSYTTICEALDVHLLDQDQDFQAFESVCRSRKLVACRIQRTTTGLPDAAAGTSSKSRAWLEFDPRQGPDSGQSLLCQPSPVSLTEASSPPLSGSNKRRNAKDFRPTQSSRPINGRKHCRSEPTTSSQHSDPWAKRRKTQQNEEMQGHGGVGGLSDEAPVAESPPERLPDDRWAGREATSYTSPGFGPLPSPPLTHAGSELGKLHDRTRVSAGRCVSPLDLVFAAVEQDSGTTAAGWTVSKDRPFDPWGNPELMVGAPIQPGARGLTAQSRGAEISVSCWQETTYSMMETSYDEGDDSIWNDFVDFDCPPEAT